MLNNDSWIHEVVNRAVTIAIVLAGVVLTVTKTYNSIGFVSGWVLGSCICDIIRAVRSHKK